MEKDNKKVELDKALEGFLNTENKDPNMDCTSGVAPGRATG